MSHGSKLSEKTTYDLAGVGIGPFNLSLAALLEGVRPGERPDALFFERKDEFDWHPGMILPGTTLQVPFLADLVSMADPTSPFSFLNYLHENQRLYRFYFYENFKIFRREYNLYCRWVADRLPALRFASTVEALRPEPDGFAITYRHGESRQEVRARNVVLGYGTTPRIPYGARAFLGDGVEHTANYRNVREDLMRANSVAVIGSGQSAAECVLDLLNGRPEANVNLDWFTRGAGFLPMEYSKLGLEYFSPEYIDHFFALEEDERDRIRSTQDLFYKGISTDSIAAIYDRLYELSLAADPRVCLAGGLELTALRRGRDGRFELHLRHREDGGEIVRFVDKVLLGTGYEHKQPEFLDALVPSLERDGQGRLAVQRDYSVRRTDGGAGRLFVQNAEIHSHGIGAPDLGLGAYRAASIVNSLLDSEIYRLDRKNVFQHFGTAELVSHSNIRTEELYERKS